LLEDRDVDGVVFNFDPERLEAQGSVMCAFSGPHIEFVGVAWAHDCFCHEVATGEFNVFVGAHSTGGEKLAIYPQEKNWQIHSFDAKGRVSLLGRIGNRANPQSHTH